MRISHETIYKTVYVQGRGELRRELARRLRTGRARRVRRGRFENRPRIQDMVMISERPPEVEDRAVPGHWEGDLLMDTGNKSAIGTPVERSTRYVMLFPLTEGKSAEDVRIAMTKVVQTLPASLRHTLTWDRGVEMAEHVRFKIDTGVQVYSATRTRRGNADRTRTRTACSANTSRKKMDLSKVRIQAAADGLNGRPRETLGWKKPAEKLAELLR
jgi:transposase, IS30 family